MKLRANRRRPALSPPMPAARPPAGGAREVLLLPANPWFIALTLALAPAATLLLTQGGRNVLREPVTLVADAAPASRTWQSFTGRLDNGLTNQDEAIAAAL